MKATIEIPDTVKDWSEDDADALYQLIGYADSLSYGLPKMSRADVFDVVRDRLHDDYDFLKGDGRSLTDDDFASR